MSFVITHPDVEGDAVIPERALAAYARNGWTLSGRIDDPTPSSPPQPMEQPARSATAAAWKTYAVVAGMDYEQAMAATRDELADHYNPAPKPDPTPTPKSTPKAGTPAKTDQES